MKQKFLLFVCTVFAGAALVSCSKDDDGDGGSSASIVGKWEFYKGTEYADGQVVYVEDWEHQCTTKKDYVQFKEDGTVSFVYYNEICDIEESSTASYTVSGSNLVLNYNSGEVTVKIITLDSSKLIVETEEEEWEGVTSKYRTEMRR